MTRKKKYQSARKKEQIRARVRSAKFSDAKNANTRGDRVPPTVEGYSEAASVGERAVAEALIARHNLRMASASSIPEWIRAEILSSIVPICHLDIVVHRLGARSKRPPVDGGDSVLENLAWGLDSVVAACRLLLCGQIAVAAVIARNQVEAWTTSRASIAELTKEPGEQDSDFIARALSAPLKEILEVDLNRIAEVLDLSEEFVEFSDPDVQHTHVQLKDGKELCPAGLWVSLSELLHGRGFTQSALWDASCLPENEAGETVDAIFLVLDTLRLCLSHIRSAMHIVALGKGEHESAAVLAARIEEFSFAPGDLPAAEYSDPMIPPYSAELVSPPLMAMAPLAPEEGLSPQVLELLKAMSDSFEAVIHGQRPIGREYRDDELVTAAFGWHRHRSARFALDAIELERQALGEEFDLDGLQRRVTAWIFVTEAASLLSLWTDQRYEQQALALMGSALRSSWWLWLEDDDRAMGTLRVVFEQAARLRVWLLKPEKGPKLEARSSPRDWVEHAGWKRLGPLNSALGEFSHLTQRSDWGRARLLLTDFQDEDDSITAPHTARRSAMELVTLLVAVEVRERVEHFSPTVADAFKTLFQQLDVSPLDEDKYLETRLNFINSFRKAKSPAGH